MKIIFAVISLVAVYVLAFTSLEGNSRELSANNSFSLVDKLQHYDHSVKRRALDQVIQISSVEGTATILPHLLTTLQDNNCGVRGKSATTLGKIGFSSKQIASALVIALDDPQAHVRAKAARALGTIGTPSQEVEAALQEAQEDESGAVRRSSQWALKNISKNSESKVELTGNAS